MQTIAMEVLLIGAEIGEYSEFLQGRSFIEWIKMKLTCGDNPASVRDAVMGNLSMDPRRKQLFGDLAITSATIEGASIVAVTALFCIIPINTSVTRGPPLSPTQVIMNGLIMLVFEFGVTD